MGEADDRRSGLAEGAAGRDGRPRSTDFVSAAETVVLDVRRHPWLLVPPLFRTLAGLVVLVAGLGLLPVLAFAALVAAWARGRLAASLRTTALLAGGIAAGLAVLSSLTGPGLPALLLLGWLAEDVADWYTDRMVVSDKRIYRRYGVITRHSPSIALTGIAFLDASVPPLGRLLHFGTLRLDSVAQRDAPLSHFDHVPEVTAVSHEILRLRTQALPRFPQQPL
ncbi:MAG: hypothetical protein JWN57_1929 [Frankiales bacterium]|nr:hypothetical protein [Frankiales bacterium]